MRVVALSLAACTRARSPWAELARRPSAALGAQPGDTRCRLTWVIDGDSVEQVCTGTFIFPARVEGSDTPETWRPTCEAEGRHAQRAADRLRRLVARGDLRVVETGRRDRSGRLLVELVGPSGNVADRLIDEGLAVPHDGATRIDGCAALAAART